MDYKRCSHCKKDKPITDFWKDKSQKSGIANQCKDCKYAWGKVNPDKVREFKRRYMRGYRLTINYRFSTLKRSAKRYNRSVNMTLEEFSEWSNKQSLVCSYCEQKLTHLNGLTALTIDRVDNTGNYELDNIVLACRRCDSIKGSWFTYKQMKEIAQKYFLG